MLLILHVETWALGRPNPKCVETICRMENMVAEIAANVIKASGCQSQSTLSHRKEAASPSCQLKDLTKNTRLPALQPIAAELNTTSTAFVARIAGLRSPMFQLMPRGPVSYSQVCRPRRRMKRSRQGVRSVHDDAPRTEPLTC
jgi:hypothetical protein